MWYQCIEVTTNLTAPVSMTTSSNGNIFPVAGPLCGEIPSQWTVTRSFDVFFDLRLNKRLSKQLWDWWFEMPLRSLWCHCNVYQFLPVKDEGQAHILCLIHQIQIMGWVLYHIMNMFLIKDGKLMGQCKKDVTPVELRLSCIKPSKCKWYLQWENRLIPWVGGQFTSPGFERTLEAWVKVQLMYLNTWSTEQDYEISLVVWLMPYIPERPYEITDSFGKFAEDVIWNSW